MRMARRRMARRERGGMTVVRTLLSDRALRDVVGDDLVALVRDHAFPVVSVSRVSSLSSRSWDRAAFRLTLADGSSRKGRRFESTMAAERVSALASYLPSGPFPRTIAARGVAHLEDWIDGTVLAGGRISDGHRRRAGAIARAIHSVDLPASFLAPAPGAGSRDALAARVGRLAHNGALSPDDGARALELAETYTPTSSHVGLVHGDICPENIVIDTAGDLRVIDNDSLAVRPREFDLARIWYRWAMTIDERRVFEDGYGPGDVLDSYRAYFPHWAVTMLVTAADFRCRHGLPDVATPIERLLALMR